MKIAITSIIFSISISAYSADFKYCANYLSKAFALKSTSMLDLQKLNEGKIQPQKSEQWEISQSKNENEAFDQFDIKTKDGEIHKFWITYRESGFPEELKYQTKTKPQAKQLLFNQRKGFCVLENENDIALNKVNESKKLTYSFLDCNDMNKAIDSLNRAPKNLKLKDKIAYAKELMHTELDFGMEFMKIKNSNELISKIKTKRDEVCSSAAAKEFDKIKEKKTELRTTASNK